MISRHIRASMAGREYSPMRSASASHSSATSCASIRRPATYLVWASHAPMSRAMPEPPCDRCVRSLELQEQNRVVAAGTARALEVCACIIGPLELLCRLGCTQPGARAITRRTQSVCDALPPLHRKPVVTELRGQRCEFALQLALLRRVGRQQVDESGDRPQPVEADQPAHGG